MSIAWTYLDKKAAAINALKDFYSMDFIVQQQPVTIQAERERLVSIGANVMTGMPGAHDPQAGEARLVTALDEIDVMAHRLRLAQEYMAWFKPAWDMLSEGDRYVLTIFYMSEGTRNGTAVDIVSDHYHIERSSAYKRKNRALSRLAVLLYGA